MGLISWLFGQKKEEPRPGLGIEVIYKEWSYGRSCFTHETYSGILVELVPEVPTKYGLPESKLFAAQAMILDDRGFFVQVPLDHVRCGGPHKFFYFREPEFHPDPQCRPDAKPAKPEPTEPLVPQLSQAELEVLFPTHRYRELRNENGDVISRVGIPPGYEDVQLVASNPTLQLGPIQEEQVPDKAPEKNPETSGFLKVVGETRRYQPLPLCTADGRQKHDWTPDMFDDYVSACLTCEDCGRRTGVLRQNVRNLPIATFVTWERNGPLIGYDYSRSATAPSLVAIDEAGQHINVSHGELDWLPPPMHGLPACEYKPKHFTGHHWEPISDDGPWKRRVACKVCKMVTAIYEGPQTKLMTPGMYAYFLPGPEAFYISYMPDGLGDDDEGRAPLPDLKALLAEACKVIEGLAGQQEMEDSFYEEPLARFKAAAGLT